MEKVEVFEGIVRVLALIFISFGLLIVIYSADDIGIFQKGAVSSFFGIFMYIVMKISVIDTRVKEIKELLQKSQITPKTYVWQEKGE